MFSANRSCTSRNSPSSTTRRDHLLHVVRLVRIVGNERVEVRALAIARIGRLGERRRVEVVLRQEREEIARVVEAGLLVGRDEVCDAAARRVRRRASQLLERHLLARHRLHDVGPGDEHVRRALDHEDEIRHRGRVDGAARARTHDERYLRDDARSTGRCARRSPRSRPARRRPPGCARRPSR